MCVSDTTARCRRSDFRIGQFEQADKRANWLSGTAKGMPWQGSKKATWIADQLLQNHIYIEASATWL